MTARSQKRPGSPPPNMHGMDAMAAQEARYANRAETAVWLGAVAAVAVFVLLRTAR